MSKSINNRIKNFLMKEEVIKEYGSICECCNINIWQFLTIDHVNNDGAAHRLITKRRGIQFYRWLKKENFPKNNYRLLCNNCNSSYGHNGYCCHSLNYNKLNCSNCKEVLSKNNTYKNYDINLCNNCVDLKAIVKNKTINIDAKRKRYAKQQTITTKANVINGYGKKCKCCGEENQLLLTIDHVNNGGTKIRNDTKIFGVVFYRWLISNNFPSDYQLLCYNCNCSKGAYGQCYHELCKNMSKNNVTINEYIITFHNTKGNL